MFAVIVDFLSFLSILLLSFAQCFRVEPFWT